MGRTEGVGTGHGEIGGRGGAAVTDLFKGGAVVFGERGELALEGGIAVVFYGVVGAAREEEAMVAHLLTKRACA